MIARDSITFAFDIGHKLEVVSLNQEVVKLILFFGGWVDPCIVFVGFKEG